MKHLRDKKLNFIIFTYYSLNLSQMHISQKRKLMQLKFNQKMIWKSRIDLFDQ